jgi:hypothetical protein
MENFTDPKQAALTEETLYRLNNLLQFVSPDDLREYLLEIYHQYIIHEHENLPNNFSEMAGRLQILFDFLKFLEEEMQSESSTLVCNGDN